MGDGVQFIFELDAKAPGMDKLLAGIDRTNASLKQGHGALKKHAEGAHELEGAFGKLIHNGLEPFLKKAEQIAEFEFIREGAEKLLEFPERLAEKLKELGEEIVATAAKAESLNFSMNINFGEEGEKNTEWLDRLAKQTPFTGAQLKGWVVDLGHAGVAAKDLQKYLFAGLDVAARSSDKLGAMSQAMQVFKKLSETGKVRGAQLGELVPAENFRFMPGFGKLTKQQIFEKLGEKDLNPEEVFRGITGGKPIGETGADMQNLLDTKLKNIKTLPEQYYEKAADSPAMEPFKGKLDELYKSFDPSSEHGQAILKSFNDMLMTVVDGIQQIDFKALAADFREFIAALKELLPTIGWVAGSTAKTIKDTAHVTSAVTKPFIGPMQASGDADKAADEILRRRGKLPSQSSVGNAFATYVPAGKWLEDEVFNPSWWKLRIGMAVQGGVKGLEEGMPAMEAAGAGAGAAAVKGASGPEGIDAHSPSKKFEQLGMFANMGFARGLRGSVGALSDAVAAAYSIALPPRRAGGAGAAGGARVSFGDVQVHLQHGGREEGEAAGAGFMASVEARIISLLQRKTTEEGGS